MCGLARLQPVRQRSVCTMASLGVTGVSVIAQSRCVNVAKRMLVTLFSIFQPCWTAMIRVV